MKRPSHDTTDMLAWTAFWAAFAIAILVGSYGTAAMLMMGAATGRIL